MLEILLPSLVLVAAMVAGQDSWSSHHSRPWHQRHSWSSNSSSNSMPWNQRHSWSDDSSSHIMPWHQRHSWSFDRRSQSQSRESPIDVGCYSPLQVGPCNSNVPRFYFDSKSKTCKPFNWGGCEGNANKFKTLNECNKNCGRVAGRRISQSPDPCQGYKFTCKGGRELPCNYRCNGHTDCDDDTDEIGCDLSLDSQIEVGCHSPPQVGLCKMDIPRFYFDSISKTCKPFIWGGCRGNANNFKTITECASTCGIQPLTPSDTCKLPFKRGPCHGDFPRFYHNHKLNRCEMFIYGGCKGNANIFKTLNECNESCGRVAKGQNCYSKSVGVCPGAAGLFIENNGNCFHFSSDAIKAKKATWLKAREHCKAIATKVGRIVDLAELANPDNILSDGWLMEMITAKGKISWLGAQDLNHNGNWFWAHTGRRLSISDPFWGYNEPTSPGIENCLSTWKKGNRNPKRQYMNDKTCNSKMHYVCQIFD